MPPPPMSAGRKLKCVVLHVCSALGLFHLTRRLYGRRLHILCYHGFETIDEVGFRPKLFISRDTFDQRLKHLARVGMNVLPLGTAIEKLEDGTLPRDSVAITIDDGFRSTLTVAGPLLKQHAMPATVYVTTYYMEKEVPVFRLGMQYVFWKARDVDVARVASQLPQPIATAKNGSANDLLWNVIRHGEALDSEDARQALLTQVATLLGVDLTNLHGAHTLSMLSAEQVKTLADQGFDIQLHTHRHRFPREDRQAAEREISENQTRLEAITGREARHFCYPSGIFHPRQWPWLQDLAIRSATTCLPGSNARGTSPFGLRRFLDSEDVRQIEFAAEMAGFNELLRAIRRLLRSEQSESLEANAHAS